MEVLGDGGEAGRTLCSSHYVDECGSKEFEFFLMLMLRFVFRGRKWFDTYSPLCNLL